MSEHAELTDMHGLPSVIDKNITAVRSGSLALVFPSMSGNFTQLLQKLYLPMV